MRLDRQYLEKHGNQWRVQVKVPPKLRPIIGKARLVHPLHTDSLANANRDKLRYVQAFRDQLARAEAELRRKGGQPSNPLVDDALRWREALARDKDEGSTEPTITDADWAFQARVDELERQVDATAVAEFTAIATGVATPLASMIDAWLAHKPMKPRQQIDYRRAVMKLEGWLSSERLPATIEGVTRKVAGQYVSRALVAQGVHWRTANKDISCLSSYWKWLEPKGFARENVWTRQSLPERKAPMDERKRPFTDAEVRVLLAGEAPTFLKDAITIAALSGMRVEETAKLRVAAVQGGVFNVKDAKTEAGNRLVPVHSGLTAIIARRTDGKGPQDWLFPELPVPAKDSPIERSQKIVKAFTRYRRGLGVDDRVEGARQARVDLHSFRRWFMKSAGDALKQGATGYDPWTIADVVGHNAENMALGLTMAHYPGPSDIEARRACVEAVKLPT